MSTAWPVVFMGTPQIAAITLNHLIQGPDPIVGVVTQPDRPSGRGQKSIPSPVRKVAEAHSIPVVAPEKIRDPGFISTLKYWKPEIIVVVAYGRILPKTILDLPAHGCLNVHYSLLPKYRGAAPTAWTIINGDPEAGVTTMQLVEKMDAGPIYLQEAAPVTPDETMGSLQAKLTPVGAQLLMETLRRLKLGSLKAAPQDESAVSFAPILKKEDGLVDWRHSAIMIERRVRGLDPWPGAYTHINGKVLKIHRAKIMANDRSASPGEVVRADGGGLWVATGSGTIGLEEVQLENRKRLPGVEFLRGARINPGDRLQ